MVDTAEESLDALLHQLPFEQLIATDDRSASRLNLTAKELAARGGHFEVQQLL